MIRLSKQSTLEAAAENQALAACAGVEQVLTRDFILAGRAVFTLELPESFAGEHKLPSHYTFRVVHRDANANWGEAWFAQLLTGPDNTNDYTYIGLLHERDGSVNVTLTKSSKLTADSMPYRLLVRALKRVWANEVKMMQDAGFWLHHEGRCGRCGRTLTVPESIRSGIGPECAKIMGLE